MVALGGDDPQIHTPAGTEMIMRRCQSRVSAGAVGVLALILAATAGVAAPAKVRVASGVLVGETTDQVTTFKGIPYAAAPGGALRWAPPQAAAPWNGPRAATKFGAFCPQRINADGKPNEGGAFGATSEDCLFLNVEAAKGAAKAPVMIWLHGGGNTTGGGSLGAYDGSAFVRDGVILVTINYRLGALGFFAHPALTKADEPLVSYGIMDQIAALKWVRRNIAAFGGDPDNVTVFGESAGGADTLDLITARAARGLFAKAIIESGLGWAAPIPLTKAETQGAALSAKAGAPADATVEQLRALPVAALAGLSMPGGGMVTDGRLLTESPSQAFANGHEAHVPLISGTNDYEASLMRTFKIPAAAVLTVAPASLKAVYADAPTDEAKAAQLFTDSLMGAPARWVAAKSADHPAWLYHFAYVPQMVRATRPGAGHASEIPFVFASWDTLGVVGEGIKPTPEDLMVTRRMHACWVAFAKTGVPSCAGAPTWPAYTAANDTLLDFDADGVAKLRTGFRKAQYDAQATVILPTLKLTESAEK